MKVYETVDIVGRWKKKLAESAFRYIQEIFQGIDLPDVEGQQVRSISAQNVVMSEPGFMTIVVDVLGGGETGKVEIRGTENNNSVYVSNAGGYLAFSSDNTNWTYLAGIDAAVADMDADFRAVKAVGTAPVAGDTIRLYGIAVDGVVELHAKFTNGTDKKLADDAV